jgi:hypothetical protein
VSLREGDDLRAVELCEQALALSRLHDTPLRHARKLSDQAGVVASAGGRLDDAIAMCVDALAVFREHDSLDDAAMALNNLGWLEIERHDAGAGAMHIEEGASIFRALGLEVGLQVALTNLGVARAGAPDGAPGRLRTLLPARPVPHGGR